MEQKASILFHTMQLHDAQGKHLYFTAEERRAFIATVALFSVSTRPYKEGLCQR